MLAALIITFRELLEVCLIIGIISAALNNLSNKKKIIFSGIIGGLISSSIIALFINYISAAFNDTGQEILNIIILSSSIFCIALTIIWINKNSNDLHHKIHLAKERLINKEINAFVLILIIMLAISREGAELILFLHGVYASSPHLASLIMGILMGAIMGISVGFLLYNSLLRIPVKYFFKVINIMLVLLAAGMSSNLAILLNSADLISILYSQVWDSSWLINEESIIGQTLHNLIGYSAKPTQLQVIFYSFTIIAISLLLYNSSKDRKHSTSYAKVK